MIRLLERPAEAGRYDCYFGVPAGAGVGGGPVRGGEHDRATHISPPVVLARIALPALRPALDRARRVNLLAVCIIGDGHRIPALPLLRGVDVSRERDAELRRVRDVGDLRLAGK